MEYSTSSTSRKMSNQAGSVPVDANVIDHTEFEDGNIQGETTTYQQDNRTYSTASYHSIPTAVSYSSGQVQTAQTHDRHFSGSSNALAVAGAGRTFTQAQGSFTANAGMSSMGHQQLDMRAYQTHNLMPMTAVSQQFSQNSQLLNAQYVAGSERVVGHEVIKGAERIIATNIIGHEYGAERLVSCTERIDEENTSIVSERMVDHRITVPKKVVREEVYEKIIVVPEKIIHEEIIEEEALVQEKIIEVAKPIIQEKIIEIPEIEIVERVIEVPERVIQEKIKQVPKIEIQERIVEVPKIITQEKVVEVPEIQYRDVPVERVIEVPDVRVEEVIKHVPVPQYIEKPVPEHVVVEVLEDVHRKMPVPVEAITTFEYRLPQLRAKYRTVKYPVYLPKFIEVPIASELVQAEMAAKIATFNAQLTALHSSAQAVSLCEVENLAANIRNADIVGNVQRSGLSIQQAITQAFQTGAIKMTDAGILTVGNSGQMSTSTHQYTTTTQYGGTNGVQYSTVMAGAYPKYTSQMSTNYAGTTSYISPTTVTS